MDGQLAVYLLANCRHGPSRLASNSAGDPAMHEGVGSFPHFVIPAQAGIYML